MSTSHPEAAVVSGASSGIGRAIAQRLLDQGRIVVNLDRSLPDWSHPRMSFYAVDLCKPEETQAIATEIAERFAVSALVNNAGATRPGTIDTVTADDMQSLFQLHLASTTLLVKTFLPSLRASGCGRIVNMSSRAALGKAERFAYSATKAGLIGLTRTLALELGPDAITVNAVGPGPIATELFRLSNAEGAPRTQRILESIAVGRMGTPDDVASAVMFFLAPENSFVTGQILYVCGGATLGYAPV